MSRTAHNSRPEIQARKIANGNNPEWVRRNALYRESTGYKRERVIAWNLDWNKRGRPADHPDFPAWDEVNKPLMDAARKLARQTQREQARQYAIHVAPYYQALVLFWAQVVWREETL